MRDLVLAAAVLLAAGAAPAQDHPADSLVVDLPDLVVTGAAGAPPAADRTRLPAVRIALADPRSLADLGTLLPSARVAVNSRGDAHLMVRGAPERHVQTFLDGIPLNLPWDERVDLETVPAVGVGAVEGRRGPTTLMDGPGALAGSVRLLPPADVTATRATASFGEWGYGRAELVHGRRAGAWSLMGAGAWRARDAWPLPGGGPRAGSDLRQGSLLLRGARPLGGTGRLSLLATGWTAEKGVPPELHDPANARHWRYPVRERALLGAALDLPLDAAGKWDLGAAVSADLFHQEIDPRGPDRWGAPLLPGDPYEKNWDRTGYGRLRLTRWLGSSASVAVQASARYAHHRESVAAGAPVQAYAQWLTAVAAEGHARLADAWTVRAGLGRDHAATPEAGDKPANAPDGAVAANLRVVRDLGRHATVHAAASRRSRFPSLRESYSGALGRFVPNPDLGPERQDQVEAGAAWRRGGLRLEGSAFLGRLEGGIERVALGGGTFQRVNRGTIRVPGFELVGSWRARPDLTARLQHTVLAARVEQDAGPDRPAEDRPDYQSLLGLSWRPDAGPGAAVEARVTGPRWSADGTAPGGLTRLPAGVTWHLRLAWRWPSTAASTSDVALHLRLDNVFDQRVDAQAGLPEPGRVLSGGVAVDL